MVNSKSFKKALKFIFSFIFVKNKEIYKNFAFWLINILINGFLLAYPLSVLRYFDFNIQFVLACGLLIKFSLDYFNEFVKIISFHKRLEKMVK